MPRNRKTSVSGNIKNWFTPGDTNVSLNNPYIWSCAFCEEVGSLKQILSTLFKSDQQLARSRQAAPKKPKRRRTEICVDLNKLDEKFCLSSWEKKRLISILNRIKCDDLDSSENVKTGVRKKKKKKKTVVKKDDKSFTVENDKSKNPKRSSTTKENSAEQTFTDHCKRCKECQPSLQVLNKKTPPRRKQRMPISTISTPQKGVLENKLNININNFEVMYKKPTYIVQYSSIDGENFQRERCYSNTALEAHLGRRPCPQYQEDRIETNITPMHYDISTNHIIGTGPVTEQMRKETLKERQDWSVREVGDRAARRDWPRDPLPSYMLPSEHRAGSVTSGEAPATGTNKTRCKKLVAFLRRCLCLSGGEKSDLKLVRVESPVIRIDKEDFLRNRIKTISKEEFFKKSKPPEKDSTRQKGAKDKRVVFKNSANSIQN